MSQPTVPPAAQEAMEKAANRLHHLSLRYVGALVEIAKGQPIGLLPRNYPGLREGRDFIDLILFTRAEINALTHCLHEARLLDLEKFTARCAEEYEYLAQVKAQFLGCQVTDAGLSFSRGER